MEDIIQFTSVQKAIPNLNKYGYLLGGANRSDDLFMYITTKISGLNPHAKYSLSVSSLSIATNVPKGLTGVGGRPGE